MNGIILHYLRDGKQGQFEVSREDLRRRLEKVTCKEELLGVQKAIDEADEGRLYIDFDSTQDLPSICWKNKGKTELIKLRRCNEIWKIFNEYFQ